MTFFLIASAVLMLIYSYIGQRIITPAGLAPARKICVWTGFLLSALFLPLSFWLLSTGTSIWLGDLIGWLGYIGLGFFSIVFLFLILRDLIWLIWALAGRCFALPGRLSARSSDRPRLPDPGRRLFLMRSMNLGILGASGLFTGYGLYEARRRPLVVQVQIPIASLPPAFEGFRIVQISDIHAGPTIKRDFVASVVEQANELRGDMVVFTGDLADGPVSVLQRDVSPLGNLHAPEGKFFVTGNHEYYSGALEWIEEADKLGFTVLLNEHRIIRRGEESIILAGATDYNAGRFIRSHESDPAGSIAGSPEGIVKILLAHQPRSIFEAAKAGFDLQVSGHTHGGQTVFWSSIIALTQPFIKGLHHYAGTWVYVSKGAGYWGPPLRVGVPSEITVIKLARE